MKSIVGILMVTAALSSTLAIANEYTCEAPDGTIAKLVTSSNGRDIQWSEPATEADSNGRFNAVETAPYSPFRGYFLYNLTDLYSTPASGYVLALSPNARTNSKQITAIEYFDNDDHEEDVTPFACTKTNQ